MPRKTAADPDGQTEQLAASMRPRPDAAENVLQGAGFHDAVVGFNEAA